MKALMVSVFLCLAVSTASAQTSCTDMIDAADQSANSGQYRDALMKYIAAKNCDSSLRDEVDTKTLQLFDSIDGLTQQAEQQEALAKQSLEQAEENVKAMSELIGEITDLVQHEDNEGIVGLYRLESQLFELLLPYHQFIANNSTQLDKPWESARTHYRLGRSFESLGNSLESEKEIQASFEKAKLAAEIALSNQEQIQEELHTTLIDAAVYQSWILMNKNQINEAETVLEQTRKLTQHIEPYSAATFHSHSSLENAFSRLFIERNEPDRSYQHQMEAVELARSAVEKQESSLRYQRQLAVYLRNLDLVPDSLLSPEAQAQYLKEGCQLIRTIDNTSGSGSLVLSLLAQCVYDESIDLVSRNEHSKALDQLNQARDRLSMFIHFDPINSAFYLHRARINLRLRYIKRFIQGDREGSLAHFQNAQQDWLKIVSGRPVLPEEVWLLRSTYIDMRAAAHDIKDIKERISVFKRIAEAIDTTASVYGEVPEIGLITVDSYTLLADAMWNTHASQDSVLMYLDRAIDAASKTRFLDDITTFNNRYEWICQAYASRLNVHFEVGNLEPALADYQSIKNIFGPILQKYPFDHYLRVHFRDASDKAGRMLYNEGRYSEALPLLEYGSKWGMKKSSEYLAKMYSQGLLVEQDTAKASQLLDLARKQVIKSFTVPIDYGAFTTTTTVSVLELPEDALYQGIDDQVKWHKEVDNAIISESNADYMKQVQDLARKNNLSFALLVDYYIEQSKKEADTARKDSLRSLKKGLENPDLSFESGNDIYREAIGYANQNALAFSSAEHQVTFYEELGAYILFLVQNNKSTEAEELFEELGPGYGLAFNRFDSALRRLQNNQDKSVLYRYLFKKESEYLTQHRVKETTRESIAQHYNSFAWYLLLTGQFDEAESVINKGIALYPDNLYLYTNLAPALLFQGKYKEAREIYTEWMHKPFVPGTGYSTFKEPYLSDIDVFKEEGIIPAEHEEEVEDIITLLNISE